MKTIEKLARMISHFISPNRKYRENVGSLHYMGPPCIKSDREVRHLILKLGEM